MATENGGAGASGEGDGIVAGVAVHRGVVEGKSSEGVLSAATNQLRVDQQAAATSEGVISCGGFRRRG